MREGWRLVVAALRLATVAPRWSALDVSAALTVTVAGSTPNASAQIWANTVA